ncbi:Structural maintenance of chromosomes protein 3 [Microbotryomycetes sp. JL221]|nr:Structural maintenance of chromosomes protein 3 [Microbotryomycetes sp. JL221]
MHIKSLKIHGFKSYANETIVDPFSPGLNLLVGRNGSGKSNFFTAIRFVLSDAHTSMSREERQALLHDGSTSGDQRTTMSAYVEIEFDNSDGRFPTGKPTVLLRRTIGNKKDEYQLDRKSTSKGEVMSLLESAGFSRSNPYYIVPQGRVTHLTNQKDNDRLNLLKEVAGTKVYEERRTESTKIMEETNVKRQKIDDFLTFINDRLSELEQEKEELREFQVQDRSRRSLEYLIYQRELKEVGDALDLIEEERRKDIDEANTRREASADREKEVQTINTQLADCRQKLDLLKIDHANVSDDRREATKAKAEVECIINDAEDANSKDKSRKSKLEKDLKKLETEITTKEASLMDVTPSWEDKSEELRKSKQSLEHAETRLQVLYGKQGRKNQFKTQKERDQHLNRAIKERDDLIKDRKQTAKALEVNLTDAQSELQEVQTKVAQLREDHNGRKGQLEEAQTKLDQLREQQSERTEKRKSLWKESSKLDSQFAHASDALKDAERFISSTMDRDTAAGLKAAAAIASRLNLHGYYGPLYDLFQPDNRYKVPAEVIAGNSLFQIVVDNDDTASKILDIMIKEKSGRVTFMPLNRLKTQTIDYPDAADAVALIKKLQFEPQFRPAIQQVFGKVIVCKTLEVAGAYTRSHDLTSITLDGDKYDRKGSLTGGYHDKQRSRLDAVNKVKDSQSKVDELMQEREEVQQALTTMDQEITQIKGQVYAAEKRIETLNAERGPLVNQMLSAQKEVERLKSRVDKLQHNLDRTTQDVESLTMERDAYKVELTTKMDQTLNQDELNELDSLNEQLEQSKKMTLDLSRQVAQLENEKNQIEIELTESLRPRRQELQGKIEAIESGNGALQQTQGTVNVAARKAEVARLEKQIQKLSNRIEEIDQEAEMLDNEIDSLEKEREKVQARQVEDQRTVSKQQKNVERYLSKRQMLLQRKDACNKNIRDLGVLPDEAFVETTASSEKLAKRLRKVHEALKGFAHVNKKAYEQYTSFTKQRDDLIKRQYELDTSATSITELIDALDARKDEAIERTFKQVAKNFETVFEKLVPAGKGRLIMLRRNIDRDADDMDVDGEQPEVSAVENYTGVAIRVSFNSKASEGLKIQQLSGGQKALVALAMIFAIQKCDPAPFYLFDEIDANLDADRRTAVAAMIRELSESGQYICTTFRPELIPHAESYFGVFFASDKVSTVKNLTADECQDFIEAAEQVRA